MLPDIRDFPGKLFAGMRRRMSFVNDRTSELWREFRSREVEIPKRVAGETYSVKVYDSSYSFASIDPKAEFEKWAAVEVSDSSDQFEMIEVPAGKYAVFLHKGMAADAPQTFGYIFGQWLPKSGFELDLRPHFEVLPKGYDPFDQNSQEEIWIPVQEKG